MTSRFRVRRLHDDDGVALVLALIFVLVMSFTVTALLPYASTGIQTSSAVRDVRTVQHAADGAVDQAINSIRGSFVKGASPACGSGSPVEYLAPDYPNPAPEPGVTKIRVRYCNTGASSPIDDQPPYAIQTLIDGLEIDGNAPLLVTGGVLVKNGISVKGTLQSLNVEGDLYATGACPASEKLVVSGVLRCSNSPTAYVPGTDPDPTLDPLADLDEPTLASVSTEVDPLGTCGPAADSVVRFRPGLYTESPQVDPVTCPPPKHTTWWFQPGAYYFDFPDSTFTSAQYGDFDDADAGFAAQNITIVGGTPANWNPDTSSSNDVSDLFKADANHSRPACADGSPGVTFFFGGPTNISIGTGGTAPAHLELCSAAAGTQRISLFGLRDDPSRVNTPTPAGSNPGAAGSSTIPAFAPATNARGIDTVPAVASLIGGTATSATIDLSDFASLASSVPDGSIITGARLRVNHWTTSPTGAATARKVEPSITYSSDLYPPTKVDLPTTTTAPAVNAGFQHPLPLPAGTPRWKSLRKALENFAVSFTADGSDLDELKVRPRPTPAEAATAHLDGMRIEVDFIRPAIEQTRCHPGVTGLCSLVTNKVDDALFLHGTVYAPRSMLEVAVHNYSTTVFERGVVAGSILAHVSASVKQTLPPFQLPRGPSNRIVQFTAESLEPDGVTWRTRVTALVRYDDFARLPGGKTTAIPGHSVTILKWNVVR